MRHLSGQAKLHRILQPALLRSKVELLSLLSLNKYIAFFLNLGSTVMLCHLYASAILISLKIPFICVLRF
jgi:hypothetical protein